MRYIGVNLGHDSGVVALDEQGQIIFYGQCERYNRIKNHGYDLDPIGQSFLKLPEPNKDDIITIASIGSYYNWDGVANISSEDVGYPSKLVRGYKPLKTKNSYSRFIGRNPDYVIAHHFAHALAAWCFRPDDEPRLFITYDHAGMDALEAFHSSMVGKIWRGGFELIENSIPVPSSGPLNGFLGVRSAGKAMGLAGYMPKQEWTGDMAMKLIECSMENFVQPTYPHFKKDEWTEENLQWIANFYRWYTNKMWEAVRENIVKFGNNQGVVIGGGSTLALELNTKIYEMTKDLVFGPPTDDTGLALGAAAFAYYSKTGKWPKLTSPALNELQDPLPAIGPQDPNDIAKLLYNNKVVGLLREKSEAGPGALGFRSILASCQKQNLKRVSQEIKNREYYRPLAPMVSAEEFDRLFIGPKGEYMQYRVTCTPIANEICPAICHIDNTARPQIVYRDKDPWLHTLLQEYGRLSGVECLINTSLNAAGKPICNTYEDARRELRGKELELISIAHNAWEPPAEKNKLLMI